MPKAFDAYHKWLGIEAEDRPPSHYRLLGIALFEGDPDVIASAADRQMTHIRSFQSGQYAAHSQKILNEIAAARICLLNAAQKADYDQQLRWRIAASRNESPQAEPFDPAQVGIDLKAPKADPAARQPRKSRPTKLPWQLPAAIGAGLLACIVVFVCWIAFNSREGEKPATQAQASTSPKNGEGGRLGKPEAAPAPAKDSASDRPSVKSAKAPGSDDAIAARPLLSLDWPPQTRRGASMSIDDVEMIFPATGVVAFPLQPRPQPYRIVLARPGFEKLEFFRTSLPGAAIEPYHVTWKTAQSPFAGNQAPAGGSIPAKPRPPRWIVVRPRPVTPPPDAGNAMQPVVGPGNGTMAAKPAKAEPSGPIVPASRPSDMPPEDFLKKYGLVKSGPTWVLEAEKNLPAMLGEINRLKGELKRKRNLAQHAAKNRLDAQRSYDVAKEQLAALGRRMDKSPVVTRSDAAVFNANRDRVEELKAAAEQAGDTADRNLAVVNTMGDSLADKVAKLHDYYDEAQRRYGVLAEAPAIARAVADYNQAESGELALGPSSIFRGLAEPIKGLAAEATAMSGRIPIQRKGKLWFVHAEINGQKTIEMAIDTGAEIVLLPWKAAIQAGLDPETGPPVAMESANGSTTISRKVMLPKLTVGKFTLANVECVVTPAETGDVMPLLGQSFLNKFNYHIDAADGVLVISTAAKGDAGGKSPNRK